jgi:hypothetical protein
MYSKTFVDDNTSSYHSLVMGHMPRCSNKSHAANHKSVSESTNQNSECYK